MTGLTYFVEHKVANEQENSYSGVCADSSEDYDSDSHYETVGTWYWMESAFYSVRFVIVAHRRDRDDGFYLIHASIWKVGERKRNALLSSFCAEAKNFDAVGILQQIEESVLGYAQITGERVLG